jgi:RNA polymerase sigma-70 factor (ECF subfamily)
VDDLDRQIVRGLRARELGAFERLYERYRNAIWAFLLRICRSRNEAEELFQDTWFSAANHAHRLAEDSDLRAWLYAIARNKHKNARRFLLFDLRRKQSFAREPTASAKNPEHEFEQSRALLEARAALDSLPAAHREVLVLSVIEGLDGKALAAVLGIQEDAVRKRLSRARTALTEALQRRERRAVVPMHKEPAT